MNPIMKLVRKMDWEDVHRPFKAEEKAELMELPDNEFEDRLRQMSRDFNNDGVIRV